MNIRGGSGGCLRSGCPDTSLSVVRAAAVVPTCLIEFNRANLNLNFCKPQKSLQEEHRRMLTSNTALYELALADGLVARWPA